MKKIFFCIYLVLFSVTIFGQNWIGSRTYSSNDNINVTDAIIDGNDIYITGNFVGNVTVNSVTYSSFDTKTDIFIAKLNSDLQTIWFEQISGVNHERFPYIALDEKNIYVTGSFRTDVSFNDNAMTLNSAGAFDVFLAKYRKTGEFVDAKTIASDANIQTVNDIEVSTFNNKLVIAHLFYTTSTIDGVVYNGGGSGNSAIIEVDTSFSNFSVKTYTSTTESYLNSISSTDNGYYLTGYYQGDYDFGLGTISSTGGSQDIFILKTDANLNTLWVRTGKGNGDDGAGRITIDNYDNVYLTGFIKSTILNFDSTNVLTSQKTISTQGTQDSYIAKYNKDGILQFVKRYGQTGKEWGYTINTRNDLLFYTGYFSGVFDFGKTNLDSKDISNTDFFVGVLDLEGNEIFADTIETDTYNADEGRAVLFNANDELIVAGNFASNEVKIGSDTYTNPSSGKNQVFVAKYSPPLSAIITQQNKPTCNGLTDGSITVTPYFGTPPYTYQWYEGETSLGVTDSVLVNRGAGTYRAIVIDDAGAKDTAIVELTEPDKIFVGNVTTDANCYGGKDATIDITVTGGNGENIYQWQAISGGGQKFGSEDQDSLYSGKYIVTVIDKNGCNEKDTISVGQASKIIFAGSDTTSVTGKGNGDGAIDLVVSGGTVAGDYLYEWDGTDDYDDAQDTLNLDGGTYYVKVKDDNQCIRDTVFFVAEPKLQVRIDSIINVACKGTSTGRIVVDTLNSLGTATFILKNHTTGDVLDETAANIISGLSVGIYRIVVKEGLEKDSAYVAITEPVALQASVDSIGKIDCFGDGDGFVDIKTNGGTYPYRFTWNDGNGDVATSEDLINVGPATYSVMITDTNNCTKQITDIKITEPVELTIDVAITESIKCFGDHDGVLTATPSGGTADGQYIYKWSDPASQTKQTADALYPGIYNVTVTDDNGCKKTKSVNLIEPEGISLKANPQTIRCYGENDGVILLTPSGGTVTSEYSYNWSNSAVTQNISGIGAGTYKVVVADDNGCKDSLDVTVEQAPEFVLNEILGNHIDNNCFGEYDGKIEVTASGGWGEYIGNPQYEYSINDKNNFTDNPVFINLISGKYKIRVRDKQASGCVYEGLDSIAVTPERIRITANKTDVSCYGGSNGQITNIIASPSASYEYSIDNQTYQSVTSFTGLTAGEHKVLAKNADGCKDSLIITLEQPNNLTFSLSRSKDSTDTRSSSSLYIVAEGGTGGLQYSIDGGSSFSTTPEFTGLDSQKSYTAVVKDQNDCELEVSSNDLEELLAIALSSGNTILQTEEVIVYPNPTDGKLLLKGEIQKIEGILVYNTDGSLVKQEKIQSGNFDLHDLEPGFYLVRFLPEGVSKPVKLVIEK